MIHNNYNARDVRAASATRRRSPSLDVRAKCASPSSHLWRKIARTRRRSRRARSTSRAARTFPHKSTLEMLACLHQESRVSERFLKCASNEGERAHRELREKRRRRARGSRSPSTSSASRDEKYRSLAVRRETRASRRRRRAGWSHHRRRAFDGATRVRTNRALEASRRRCATRRPRERVVTSRLRGLSSHTRPTSTRLGRHARRDVAGCARPHTVTTRRTASFDRWAAHRASRWRRDETRGRARAGSPRRPRKNRRLTPSQSALSAMRRRRNRRARRRACVQTTSSTNEQRRPRQHSSVTFAPVARARWTWEAGSVSARAPARARRDSPRRVAPTLTNARERTLRTSR